MKRIIAFFRDGKFEEYLGCSAIFLVIIPVIINIVNRSVFSFYSTTLEAVALLAYVWIGYGFYGYFFMYDNNFSRPYVHTRGDEVRGSIHLLHVDLDLSKVYREHTAANVDADHIGDRLILDGHGRADSAALSRVDIGHNTDLTSFSKLVIAHSANLLDCLILDDLGKADRGIDFSFDFNHCSFS